MHRLVPAFRRPIKRERQSRKPGNLHRRLRVMVLDLGADGHVFTGERVVNHTNQIVFLLADNGVRGRQNLDGPLLELAGPDRAIGGSPGKPGLRIEDAPFAGRQASALEGDSRQPVAGHLIRNVTARLVSEVLVPAAMASDETTRRSSGNVRLRRTRFGILNIAVRMSQYPKQKPDRNAVSVAALRLAGARPGGDRASNDADRDWLPIGAWRVRLPGISSQPLGSCPRDLLLSKR